jgi:hypothetical protein
VGGDEWHIAHSLTDALAPTRTPSHCMQRREIGDVVREICEHAHKADHTSFAFKFVENDNYITSQVCDTSLPALVKQTFVA